MLFGEVSSEVVAVLVTSSGIIGGAVVWMANFLIGLRMQRRKEIKEDEKTIVDHLTTQLQQLTAELRELQVEVNKLRDKYTEAVAHMRYLEGILESNKISFKSFPRESPSGDVHVEDVS